jgi:hypothetical protein
MRGQVHSEDPWYHGGFDAGHEEEEAQGMVIEQHPLPSVSDASIRVCMDALQ